MRSLSESRGSEDIASFGVPPGDAPLRITVRPLLDGEFRNLESHHGVIKRVTGSLIQFRSHFGRDPVVRVSEKIFWAGRGINLRIQIMQQRRIIPFVVLLQKVEDRDRVDAVDLFFHFIAFSLYSDIMRLQSKLIVFFEEMRFILL